MSELASMAASKITNNTSIQHQLQQSLQLHQQQQQQPSQYIQHNQPAISSPVLSIASSLISSDSSATNHQSSPDISTGTCTSTPQNHSPQTNDSLPQTPLQPKQIAPPPPSSSTATLTDIDEINNITTSIITSTTTPISTNSTENDKIYSIADNNTNDNNTLSITNTITSVVTTNNSLLPSPENDFRSTASVLEKLSMFEKLKQKQSINNNIVSANNVVVTAAAATAAAVASNSSENITKTINTETLSFNRNNKTEEIYKAVGAATDKDPGK